MPSAVPSTRQACKESWYWKPEGNHGIERLQGIMVLLLLLHKIYGHTNGNWGWSTFPAHAVGELPCGSQPPAPTCVVWSRRLKGCSAPASAVKGRLHRAYSPISARRHSHADEVQQGRNSCPWLPLLGWYGCAHALGTGQTVGWCSSMSLAFIVFLLMLSRPVPSIPAKSSWDT